MGPPDDILWILEFQTSRNRMPNSRDLKSTRVLGSQRLYRIEFFRSMGSRGLQVPIPPYNWLRLNQIGRPVVRISPTELDAAS